MKRAIRTLILTVGLVGAFVVATVPLALADGGPIPTCPQQTWECGFPPN